MKSTEWYSKEGQIYSLATGQTLALIPYFDKENIEQKATAQLMSAAPDLLEALELLTDSQKGQWKEATRKAQTAIYKAREL